MKIRSKIDLIQKELQEDIYKFMLNCSRDKDISTMSDSRMKNLVHSLAMQGINGSDIENKLEGLDLTYKVRKLANKHNMKTSKDHIRMLTSTIILRSI